VPTRTSEDVSVFAGFAPTPAGLAEIRLVGTDNAENETVISSELGTRTKLSSALTLDLTAFHNQYDKTDAFIIGTPFADPASGRLVVPTVVGYGGSATTYGFEVAAKYRPSDAWKVDFSYSYIDSNLPNTGRSFAAAKHQFQALSSLRLGSKLDFDQAVYFYGANDTGSSSYARVDLQLRYRYREDVELAIGGRHLGQSRYREANNLEFGPANIVQPELYARATWKF
jgi:outer membrane receptor protein involved in Fe transport